MMEERELRMIYLEGFVHLKEHCRQVEGHLRAKINDLYLHMRELGVTIEFFLHGWLLSLMSSCVPIEHMHRVVDSFRREGWGWLYRLVLAYLLFLKEALMLSDDQGELLMGLSSQASREVGVEWEEIIGAADKLRL